MSGTLTRKAVLVFALVLGVWGVSLRAAGFRIFDDFEDGCSTDGVPASWANSTWCLRGTQRVEDGKLVFGGAVDAWPGTWLPVALYGDVSVHFRATCNHLGQVSALINAMPGACGPRTYFAYAGYGNGNIGIGGNDIHFQRGVMAQPPQAGDAVEFKFDYTGGELQLRVWLPEKGETMPVEPLLRWHDSMFQSGLAGVYNIIRAPGGEMAYDFISIEATGEINEIFDDFEDNNPFDGEPAWWTVGEGGCADGWSRCEDGMLIIGDVAGSMVATWVPRDYPVVASVRVEAQMRDEGVLGLVMSERGCGSMHVWGFLSFMTGRIAMGHTLTWAETETGQDWLSPSPVPGEKLGVQLDLTGTEQWFRVWRPDEGEGLPDDPLLRVTEAVFPGGVGGAYFWGPQPAGGEVALDSIYLMDQPRAALRVEPPAGNAPLAVTVDGSLSANGGNSVRNVVRYQWDFGDGTVAEGVQSAHTYVVAGHYTIRLTVTDDYGVSGSATRSIAVGCPAGDTTPWQLADIGQPLSAGGACFEPPEADGDLHLCTVGTSIGSTSDNCVFLYQEVSGDFRIVVPLKSVSHNAMGAAAGVMVRASLDGNAIAGAMLLRDSPAASPHRVRFTCRPTVGGFMPTASQTIESGEAPLWVGLERRGNTLTGFYSLDGAVWTEAGTQDMDGFPDTILAGVGACRGGSTVSQAMAVVAGHPEIVPIMSPELFRRADTNADGAVDIADAICILGYLFGGPEDACKTSIPACLDAADVNDDGSVNIADAIAVLSHLFAQSGDLPAPFGSCGSDPTVDALDCLSYPHCAGP